MLRLSLHHPWFLLMAAVWLAFVSPNLFAVDFDRDIQPLLTVTKVVINDTGGTAKVSNFTLFVDGHGVTRGQSTGFNAGRQGVSGN